MAEAPKSKALLTPTFRVSFPSVFEKSSFEGGAGRYSVTGLFDLKAIKDNPDAQTKWTAIRKRLDEVCIEMFKKNLNTMVKENPSFKVCGLPTVLTEKGSAIWYRRGESKPNIEGYGPGIAFFVMASTKNRPNVVDINGEAITDEEVFYPGCYARASVLPYAFDNKFGKGVSIGLGNLQKLKDGESFSGRTTAEEDFGGDAAEFGEGVDELAEADPLE